eukprot:gene16644-19775_t
MKTSFVILAVAALLFAAIAVSDAKYSHGNFKSKKSWAFFEKFCFGTHGNGTLELSVTSDNPNVRFYFYDDAVDSWNKVYKSKNDCEWKSAMAFNNTSQPNLDGSSHTYLFSDPKRPHFWYIAAADCTGGSLEFSYKATFLNSGGLWSAQFSQDEHGLEALYLVYFFAFLALAAFSCYTGWALLRTQSYHPIVKLLTLSILLEFLSVFIILIHWGAYSHNGVGAKGLLGFGEILDLAAQITLIFVLILIAKGWAISRVTIDEKRIILGVMGGLSILYLIMFIWYKAGQDPASTVYMYDTVPGILLLIARSLSMVWFMWCGYNTYMEENHPAKRQFYLYFGIAFVVWFISLPFICIIASAVDAWVRAKTVTAFYVTFNAIGLTALSVLLSPSRASDYFTISGRVDSAGSVPYESI